MSKNTDKANYINNIYLGKSEVVEIIEALEAKPSKSTDKLIKKLIEKGAKKR